MRQATSQDRRADAPAELLVRPLTADHGAAIGRWRYEGPWRVYDSNPDDEPLSDDPSYLAVVDADGALVGF